MTGLKPTWGRTSRFGAIPLAESLDTIGPMARSAADAAAMFDVLAGFDPLDPTRLAAPVADHLGGLDGALGARGFRIGVDDAYLEGGVDDETVAAIRGAVAMFRDLGARIVPVTIPDRAAATRAQIVITDVDAARFHKAGISDEQVAPSAPCSRARSSAGLHAIRPRWLRPISRATGFAASLRRPSSGSTLLSRRFIRSRACATTRWTLISLTCRVCSGFTSPFNVSGSPSLTMPCGMSPVGIPIGVQLDRPAPFRARLLRAGHAYQAGDGLAHAAAAQAFDLSIRRVTMALTDIHYQPLTTVAKHIAAGDVSPVEVTKAILERGSSRSIPASRATSPSCRSSPSRQAKAAEGEIAKGVYRGPMHGIPIAVKDLCFTKGIRTTGGMTIHTDFMPDHDATVVSKLARGRSGAARQAAHDRRRDPRTSSEPARARQPLERRSLDRRVVVGIRRGDRAGMTYAAIGSDTGGSIRFPSACNGLTGVKPTWGRISRYGIFDLAATFDHLGPMARSAADAAAMLQCLAGWDPKDPTSLSTPVPELPRRV